MFRAKIRKVSNNQLEFVFFAAENNRSTLHRLVFIMIQNVVLIIRSTLNNHTFMTVCLNRWFILKLLKSLVNGSLELQLLILQMYMYTEFCLNNVRSFSLCSIKHFSMLYIYLRPK